MADEYVKKEVFDARMDRMEALLEKTLIEMKADNEKLRSEMNGLRSEVNSAVAQMKADNEKFRSEMRADNEKFRSELKAEILEVKGSINVLNTRMGGMDQRIGDLQSNVSWIFAAMSLLIAVIAFSPALADLFKKFRKPQITMEDVENAIDIAIKKATGLQKSQ